MADDPDLPYVIVLTIPMPGRQSAEDLATAYRLEWAECPDVTIEVRETVSVPGLNTSERGK
jgi:hypothetical protein